MNMVYYGYNILYFVAIKCHRSVAHTKQVHKTSRCTYITNEYPMLCCQETFCVIYNWRRKVPFLACLLCLSVDICPTLKYIKIRIYRSMYEPNIVFYIKYHICICPQNYTVSYIGIMANRELPWKGTVHFIYEKKWKQLTIQDIGRYPFRQLISHWFV